jgi:hypothetical protein
MQTTCYHPRSQSDVFTSQQFRVNPELLQTPAAGYSYTLCKRHGGPAESTRNTCKRQRSV